MDSFAVPFEEDDRDPKTWFLDLDYIESMWEMFRKVNGKSSSPSMICPDGTRSDAGNMIARRVCARSQGTTDRILPHGTSIEVQRLGD